MKKKKELTRVMTECERLEFIYGSIENGKFSIVELIGLFKNINVKVSANQIEAALETLGKVIKINKTRNQPIRYSRIPDEYKELNENMLAIKHTKDFITLHHLKYLAKIQKKEIENYNEILLGQLLRFDLRPDDNVHPWAFYMLTESATSSLKWILEGSPSIEHLLNDDRTYQDAREQTAGEIGVDKGIFPDKCPYNLVEIIMNRKHPLFRFRDQYLNWRNRVEK